MVTSGDLLVPAQMEQQWCDLELGASRELNGLKDAERAVSNELDQIQ